MKKYTNEFKVGVFVILCLVGLAYLVLSTGKVNIKRHGYRIYVVFDEVAGLEEKAPVMLNGLEVGKIEDIKLDYGEDKTSITLKLWLDKSAKVRENPEVSIKTLGLMGEKYIHISSSKGSSFIAPDTVINGKPYTDFDALIEEVRVISKDITKQVNKLVEGLNAAVEDNRSGIDRIIKNLETTSKNFEEFSDDIKRHPWKLLFKEKEKKKQEKKEEKKR